MRRRPAISTSLTSINKENLLKREMDWILTGAKRLREAQSRFERNFDMSQKWHGIKILGLSLLAALGLMAVTAAGAQAGEFRVGGGTFSSKGIVKETFQGTAAETNFSVAWLGFEIKCSAATLTGTMFEGGSVSAQATFKECSVVGNKFCQIYPTKKDSESKTNIGQIPILGNGNALLHGGKHYVKFPSQTFTTLFIAGAACTLPKEMQAAGSAAVQLSSALSELVEQPFSAVSGKAESALLEVSVKCAGEPAEILGSTGTVKLSGANTGKTWGLE